MRWTEPYLESITLAVALVLRTDSHSKVMRLKIEQDTIGSGCVLGASRVSY